jgi:dTDP-4-dehydrorhamnose reductase
MKVCITGGSGLFGQYLNMILSAEHELLTLYYSKPGNCIKYNSALVDITDYNKISGLLSEFKPDVILHTAAISSVKRVQEMHPKYVFAVNVNASQKLAEISTLLNCQLVYTSTDLVYAGYRGSMIKEDGKLMPASFYAETKIMGEEKIKSAAENYLILRTGLLYGYGLNGATNHFNYIFNELKNRRPVKLFYDQYRTPLSIWNAARIVSNLLKLNIKNEIINFGGKERISRLKLGELFCEEADLDCSLIERISMYDLPDIPDAADVSMNTEKLQSYGIQLMNTQDSIREIIERYNP